MHMILQLMVSYTFQKDSILDLISSLGVPSERLVAAVPTFAIHFQLTNSNQNTPGSPTVQGPNFISNKHVQLDFHHDLIKIIDSSQHIRSVQCYQMASGPLNATMTLRVPTLSIPNPRGLPSRTHFRPSSKYTSVLSLKYSAFTETYVFIRPST